jgi:hypothetical protein
MVLDVEAFLDVVGDHGAGPDAAAVPGLAGSAFDRLLEEHAFVLREFAVAAALVRARFHAAKAFSSPQAQPILHGAVGSVQPAGDDRQVLAVGPHEDGLAPVGPPVPSLGGEGLGLLAQGTLLLFCQVDRFGGSSHHGRIHEPRYKHDYYCASL